MRGCGHHLFAQGCSEKKIIPAGLDYPKKNINVMKSPHDKDNRRFREAINEIQESASKMTLDAMQNYYRQLTLTLQPKLGQTSDKLSQAMQQLQNLITEEEWVEKQQTHTEFEYSLTNKQDKFSDKLTNKSAKRLEKLQNPGANPPPSRNLRNGRTRNTNNKGNKSHKKKLRDESRKHQLERRTVGKVNKWLSKKITTNKVGRNTHLEPVRTKPHSLLIL